jgi:hypothetical protein
MSPAAKNEEKSKIGKGPVGEGNYLVKQGDCIESIAFREGLFWKTIWDDPKNAKLRGERKSPNVIFPGDKLFIPDKSLKEESGSTEQRHRFRRKGVPTNVRLRFLQYGESRSNVPYRISIDGGKPRDGKLDADGKLQIRVLPNAKVATVIVGEPGFEQSFEFNLGALDPLSELSGVQQRLNNLGYGCNFETEVGESTRSALRAFQRDKGLVVSGRIDSPTLEALPDKHGS